MFCIMLKSSLTPDNYTLFLNKSPNKFLKSDFIMKLFHMGTCQGNLREVYFSLF